LSGPVNTDRRPIPLHRARQACPSGIISEGPACQVHSRFYARFSLLTRMHIFSSRTLWRNQKPREIRHLRGKSRGFLIFCGIRPGGIRTPDQGIMSPLSDCVSCVQKTIYGATSARLHLWLHHFFRGVNGTDGDQAEKSRLLVIAMNQEKGCTKRHAVEPNILGWPWNAGGLVAHCVDTCCFKTSGVQR